MEYHANRIIEHITGEDEYIFSPENKASDTLWTGFLTNRFSFWLDTTTHLLTIMSDQLSATWYIGGADVFLEQTVEIGKDNNSFCTEITKEGIKAKVRLDRLCIDFGETDIVRFDQVALGKLIIDIPRAWFNAKHAINISPSNSEKLTHAVLGRPIDKTLKERLTVHLATEIDDHKFVVLSTDGDTCGPTRERKILASEAHNVCEIVNTLVAILGDH